MAGEYPQGEVGPEHLLSSGDEIPSGDDRVEVEVVGVYQYPGGAAFVMLQDAAERRLTIWVGQSEAIAIQVALSGESLARPLTVDFLVETIQQLGGVLRHVWIYGARENVFLARACFTRGAGTVSVECRSSDGIAVGLRVRAPIYVSEAVLASSASSDFLPESWMVEAREDDEKGLRISRRPYYPRPVAKCAALLLLMALSGGSLLWLSSGSLHDLVLLVDMPLFACVPYSIWVLFRRETWRITRNSLRVERRLGRFRWSRHYLGAVLHVVACRSAEGPSASFWISERGRKRKLADGWDDQNLSALSAFVAAHTGWPLVGTDPRTPRR